MIRTSPLAVRYVVPLFIGLAVAVTAANQVKPLALESDTIVATFYSFSQGWDAYKEVRQEWRPRILSNALAGVLVKLAESRYGSSEPGKIMPYVVSTWALIWLTVIFLLYIVLTRERALLYIFGSFAAVAFAYTPGVGFNLFSPYELPALFCFSCFIGLHMLRRLEWLVILVPVAALFKETALILPVAFFFWPGVPMRRRVAFAVGTLAVTVALKGLVDLATGSPSPIFTMTMQDASPVPRYQDNIGRVLDLQAWNVHPVFIDAGLLVAMFVLPNVDRQLVMLKTLGILLVIGNFMFGRVTEYRIWFELIPLALYALDLHFFGSPLVRSWLTDRLAAKSAAQVVTSTQGYRNAAES